MNNIKLKYLPSIFPNIDFTASYIIDSDFTIEPTKTTISATEKKWESNIDNISIKRKIQSIYERQIKFEFISIERVEYPLTSVAEYVQAETEDNQILELYNVLINYEAIKETKKWRITIIGTIKEDNLINHLENSICENYYYNLSNYVYITINNPVYQCYGLPINGLLQIYFSDYPEFANLQINNTFYWHSNSAVINQYKEYNEEAVVIDKTADYVKILLRNSNISFSNSALFIFDNIRDAGAEVQVIYNPLIIRLYTTLSPYFFVQKGENTVITTKENFRFYSKLQIKEYLNCLFYISENDRWKLKYLDSANNIYFYDRKNSKTYQILETPEAFKISDRRDLTGLYEVELNGLIKNYNTKTNY